MFKYILRISLIIWISFLAQRAIAQGSGILHFEPNWCPRAEEIEELSNYMNLRMNGCCIRQAVIFGEYRESDAIKNKWGHRFAEDNAFNATCTGRILTAEEAIQDDAKRKEDIKLALIEEERAKNQKRLDAPKFLRELSKENFCFVVGTATRDSFIIGIGTYPEFPTLVKKETTRRRLALNYNQILEKTIQIGISDCQLLATLGASIKQNRTVTRTSVHVQHIYSNGLFVYTENGRVTAWQD